MSDVAMEGDSCCDRCRRNHVKALMVRSVDILCGDDESEEGEEREGDDKG